jgi:hypothetical protein
MAESYKSGKEGQGIPICFRHHPLAKDNTVLGGKEVSRQAAEANLIATYHANPESKG